MNHTHEYRCWHKHEHSHKNITHDESHYHIFVQTHKHGRILPHSHKTKIFHPTEENIEHHAKE